MSDYQPQPGEKFHLTVEATLDESGNLYEFAYGIGDKRAWLSVGSDAVVSAEPLPKPALPTAFGSRIVATISTVRTELVRVHDDPVPSPWVTRSGVPYGSNELADVEVLHDPDATQSPAEAAEPESLELPTGLGAVVQATYDGTPVVAVLSDTDGAAAPWRLHLPGGDTGWTYADDLTCTAVLSPGVEVDLP